MANYYIADLHLGHANIIRFDNRPFADLTEMHDIILNNWNSRVTGNDTVYVIGDFIWAKESEWPFYLGPLAGNKVLSPQETTAACISSKVLPRSFSFINAKLVNLALISNAEISSNKFG